jgi:hypothetical protein
MFANPLHKLPLLPLPIPYLPITQMHTTNPTLFTLSPIPLKLPFSIPLHIFAIPLLSPPEELASVN